MTRQPDPEFHTLTEFLESVAGDVGNAAMLSGVRADTLERISAGQAEPDHGHVSALIKAIPDTPDDLLRKHVVPEPEFVTTRRGTIPDGHEYMIVNCASLRQDDLMVYYPTVKRAGTQWIKVEGEPLVQGIMVTVSAGGVPIQAGKDSVARIARPI